MKVNSQRFSGKNRCQLQRDHRWSAYWTRESARRPEGNNTLNILSSGRTIQLKMPVGKTKRRYRSMDRPCRSSWKGAHEIFQVREYDARASLTKSEPARILKTPWS
jgi:hypothetical protein